MPEQFKDRDDVLEADAAFAVLDVSKSAASDARTHGEDLGRESLSFPQYP
ncbi:hypothetical protein [Microbacterium sp. USHLN186]